MPTQTYRIEVGHAHGVLPGNIVGAIANEAGIEGKNIGHIDIREDHSYVDLPGLPDEMMASLQDVRVRGEAIRIQRVDSKPDKPKFSGQSRRPDRMAEEDGGRRPYAGGGGKRYEQVRPAIRREASLHRRWQSLRQGRRAASLQEQSFRVAQLLGSAAQLRGHTAFQAR